MTIDPDHDVKVSTSAYNKFDGKGCIDDKRTPSRETLLIPIPIGHYYRRSEPVQLTTGDFEHERPVDSHRKRLRLSPVDIRSGMSSARE
jgi:hypothetical protein